MLKTGNGKPNQCALNLLKISRYENPYNRIKGMSASITDQSSALVQYQINEDVEFNLRVFEPRVELESIDNLDSNLDTFVKVKERAIV